MSWKRKKHKFRTGKRREEGDEKEHVLTRQREELEEELHMFEPNEAVDGEMEPVRKNNELAVLHEELEKQILEFEKGQSAVEKQ